MKIFDCFTFFNELELLDLRFMVLNDYVDFFVIVEANRTHTGKEKEFIFEHNKKLFSKYLNKIIYIKVTDLPTYSINNIWKAENFQRNCIDRGLVHAKLDDIIIISDLDEIPNPSTVLKCLTESTPVVMAQQLFYYYVNCKQNQEWYGSVISSYKNYTTPQELRNFAINSTEGKENGGWHYSFMGGPEKIKEKVDNIAESHVITKGVGSVSDIKRKMLHQQDLWNRTDYASQKQIIDITKEGAAPICINEFITKYPGFYYGGDGL